ncbi:deoxyribonuclease-1-like 1 isoform X2 [Lacerta agilis]|uniref:deoxyribonuclease-1-like 1 isoform X2 n=1 Tax=Lacerta agilis TaxID=80427 RepID=UPI0014196742|nr:deoxyribonuclease-1-like 1 isoform X2 [Lacerta agilis]XP_033028625.1 deoxyribonuclease-1-like 1 isoform X2 [Lacerta agilis]
MEPSCFLRFLPLLLLCPAGAPFRICAFNTQRFAQGKASKASVMDTLVKILSRCDIAVLQEVMDAKGKAVPALVAALNRYHSSSPYTYLTSPLLGRNNYQERYVFIYSLDFALSCLALLDSVLLWPNPGLCPALLDLELLSCFCQNFHAAVAITRNRTREQKTRVLDSYSYEDSHPDRPDVFAREPFIARFSIPNKKLKELVLIPQHTMPKAAETEIDALYDVFLSVKERWGTEDMIFLGDFNADCGYVAKKRWGQIRLRQDPGFHWLIGDNADTTVRDTTHCAYDRIVVHGERCLAAVVPGSAQPFNFAKEFGLSEAEALEISDHYPVEVELNRAHWRCQQASPAGLVLLALVMLAGSGYGI